MSFFSSKKRKKKSKTLRIIAIFAMILALAALATGCKSIDVAAPSASAEDEEDAADDEQSADPSSAESDTGYTEEELAELLADYENGMLVLVNKEHSVDAEYVPDNMSRIKYYADGRPDDTRYMISDAADHFHSMVEAASDAGIEIVMTSAYRSYAYQTALWNYNVERKGSEAEANKTSARPGESEHQTGLAVDLSTSDVGYEVSYDFANTDAGQWISENAWKYGFILRYTAGKEDVTGYSYEPWHVRYVGKVAAADIQESGEALEEYLERVEPMLEKLEQAQS